MNLRTAERWLEAAAKLADSQSVSPYVRASYEFGADASSHLLGNSWRLSAHRHFATSKTCMELAFYETGGYSIAHGLITSLWSSSPLAEMVDIGERVLPLLKSPAPMGFVFGAAALQTAQNLMSTASVSGGRDPTMLYGLSIDVVAGMPMQEMQFLSCQLVLRFVFGQPYADLRQRLREQPILEGALMQHITLGFLSALAILRSIYNGADDLNASDRGLLDRVLERLRALTDGARANSEFASMLLIVRAAKLAAERRPHLEVVSAFEGAIEAASGLHLLEGLACEEAVRYASPNHPGSARLIQSYLLQAYDAYTSVRR